MLRNPKSFYEQRRSNNLLKVKTFHDEEATIIGFEKSKTNPGALGAFRCKNDAGVEFSVGSGLTNAMRANPPKKGTVITYKYQNLTNSGAPRHPTFVRFYIKEWFWIKFFVVVAVIKS